jgi:hypothetical protein
MKKPKLIPWAEWRSNCGATAVEFALIAPALVTVVVGTFYLCMALYLVASMHFAVEDGARCASVNSTTCGSAGAIVTYTQSRYFGPNTHVHLCGRSMRELRERLGDLRRQSRRDLGKRAHHSQGLLSLNAHPRLKDCVRHKPKNFPAMRRRSCGRIHQFAIYSSLHALAQLSNTKHYSGLTTARC